MIRSNAFVPSLHADEYPLDAKLVAALVRHELPRLARLPVRPLASSGSSNALFRLGDDLIVRLPRQPGGTATIEKEARWLPLISAHSPTVVPEIVHLGSPSESYPESWSIVRWIDGERPTPPSRSDLAEGRDRAGLVHDLAAFLTTLRELPVPAEALADANLGWYRGEPLAKLDAQVRSYLRSCQTLPELDLDLTALLELWHAALAAPEPEQPPAPRWLHGDLVAENLLVRDGRLSGVIDFGGLSIGDPTVDLSVAWELLGPADRDRFRAALAVDDAMWLRARGWAVAIALMTITYYRGTMPGRCADRLAMARQALIG